MLHVIAAGLGHAGAALIFAAALSLIGFASIPFAFRPKHARHAIPASLSIGALLVGWTAWLVGTFVSTAVIVPLFLAATAIALLQARTWAAQAWRAATYVRALCAANWFATTATLLTIALLVPQLLLPVIDSDGLRYHLALPKLFLLTGKVVDYPWDTAAALPQLGEMLYMIVLRLAGAETAKVLHAIFFIGTLLLLAITLHRDRSTRRVAMLAPLLYAAAPVVLAPAGAAFIDHIAMFHVAVATLLIFRRGNPLAAGFALGAGVATKITTAPAVAGLLAYALATHRKQREAACLLVPMAIAFAPFAIRNFVHHGDPIYPVGYALLRREIPGVSASRARWASYFHSSVPGPFGIAWTSDPTHAQPDEVAGLHHVAGFFAVALAIRIRATRRWLALIIPWLIVGLLFRPPTRYFLAMFFGLAAFETCAIGFIRRPWRTLAAIAAVVPAFTASGHLLLTFSRPADYLLGRMPRETFLASRLPGYRAAAVVNSMPRGGQVMALDFPVPFYFDRPWIAEGVLNEPPMKQWLAQSRSAEELLARLRALDLRYIVVTPGYGGGTSASLLPLASNRREAQMLTSLRRQLRLLRTVDHTDIIGVP